MFLPGFRVVLSRVTVKQPFDKSIAYLCSEISLTPEKWPQKKNEIEAENPKNIRAPLATIFKGLFNPVFIGARNFSYIWYALIFVSLILIFMVGKSSLKELFGSIFGVIFYVVMIVTVFFYYFRSVASDLYSMEERSAIAADFLLQLNWSTLNEEMLKLLQEQIKTDSDIYKDNTSTGGVFIIIFTSTILLWSRLGESLPASVAALLIGVLVAVIFFKWMYESNRSRIVHIALNALIMVRKKSIADGELGLTSE